MSERRKEEELNLEKDSEKVLLTLRRSRKAFFIEYFCGVVLLGGLGILALKGISLGNPFRYFVLGTGFLAMAAPEVSRIFLRYKITPTKVSIIKGIIQQSQKNVHFLPLGFIPEINLQQGRIQRLLDVGTIFIHASGQASFEIKDVNRPHEILKMIEDLIKKNRSMSQKFGGDDFEP